MLLLTEHPVPENRSNQRFQRYPAYNKPVMDGEITADKFPTVTKSRGENTASANGTNGCRNWHESTVSCTSVTLHIAFPSVMVTFTSFVPNPDPTNKRVVVFSSKISGTIRVTTTCCEYDTQAALEVNCWLKQERMFELPLQEETAEFRGVVVALLLLLMLFSNGTLLDCNVDTSTEQSADPTGSETIPKTSILAFEIAAALSSVALNATTWTKHVHCGDVKVTTARIDVLNTTFVAINVQFPPSFEICIWNRMLEV
jgi:hypothetical protein